MPFGVIAAGCVRARHHPGFESLDFDGLEPGRFGYGREVSNGLAVTLALLIPLEVIAALGVVFVAARNQDVVAHNPAAALDDVGEAPRVSNFHVLEDLDPMGVKLWLSRHIPSPSGGDGS